MSEQNNPKNPIIMQERKRWGFFGIPWTFTKYTLTAKKLIVSKGLFKTTVNEILLYRIVDMTYTRTLFQKLFGTGTLIVYAHDKTCAELEIKNIKHSGDFKDNLSDAVENDRLRMKMRQSELIDADGGDIGIGDDIF